MSSLPMFIALAGARDRAAHNNETVGAVYARGVLNLRVVAIAPCEPNERVRQELSDLQTDVVIAIQAAIQQLSDGVSRALGNTAPASVVFDPTATLNIALDKSPELTRLQQQFTETLQGEPQVADALAKITAAIVDDWQI